MIENFKLIDGIKCYKPEVALENLDYPHEAFEILYQLEDTNFWFVHRNTIIQFLFEKHLGTASNTVLEIGCGTGYVLDGLHKKFPNYTLQGSEIYLEGIKFAQTRLPNIELVQLDATNMPFEDEFNAVGTFDVLEHIEEDVSVIQEVHRSLKSGGLFMISVPQHQWMWSINDDIAYHKRRYSRTELQHKLTTAGFEIVYISSFVFILFPAMYISRFFKQRKITVITDKIKMEEMNELQLNPMVNAIFGWFMKADYFLIKMGISLPFGGSLIAVAKKI